MTKKVKTTAELFAYYNKLAKAGLIAGVYVATASADGCSGNTLPLEDTNNNQLSEKLNQEQTKNNELQSKVDALINAYKAQYPDRDPKNLTELDDLVKQDKSKHDQLQAEVTALINAYKAQYPTNDPKDLSALKNLLENVYTAAKADGKEAIITGALKPILDAVNAITIDIAGFEKGKVTQEKLVDAVNAIIAKAQEPQQAGGMTLADFAEKLGISKELVTDDAHFYAELCNNLV